MTAFEEYLRQRLLDAYASLSFYGTMDPDEIARMKAKGPKLRGIPTPPEDDR